MGGAKSLRRPAIFGSRAHKKCKQPEAVGNFKPNTLRNFRARSAQSLRLSAISAWGCKQPETSRNFRDWTANRLRLSAIFILRVQKNAKSLRRPALFGTGAHKKRKQPETAGGFIMGVQKAYDIPQFS